MRHHRLSIGRSDVWPRTIFHPLRGFDQYLVVAQKTGFVDQPIGCVTNQREYVATVTCGYEGREGSKVTERGVDIFQLYSDGKRWWILSVVWDKESPDNPIPAELLPKK